MLQPGSQFGRYEIQRRLGRGGMGTVYVAHDPVLGRMVAIKIFLRDLDLPDAAERFAREARAAAALNHPNIVTIHDFGEFSSEPYLVMEYVPGETMADVIRRKAALPLTDKLRWMEELCAGAAYAHQIGLIHRDIKPTNLMIDRSGRIKILDFGIARMLGGTPASNATALIGTPGYMAPEQILGGAVDHRADLFSIGVVCYELLSYTEAFPGETVPAITHRIVSGQALPLSQVMPDVHPELAQAIERALQKSAADRFPDADALRAAIARIRRQIESDPGWESAGSTLPGRGATPGPAISRPGTGSARQRVSGAIGVAELTPPPDPRRFDREALARRRASQIEGSLQQARALLAAGDLDGALEACVQALTLDDTNADALDIEAAIKAADARQRAGALFVEAREELARGALTGAQDLLQQARELDPDSAEGRRLERDLRLARAEQERVRQRAVMVAAAVDSARRALASGDVEAALAFARQGRELDPSAQDARALEADARRRLEEETGPAGSDLPEPTVLRAPAASAGLRSPEAVAPTLIAPPSRRTPIPAAAPGDAATLPQASPALAASTSAPAPEVPQAAARASSAQGVSPRRGAKDPFAHVRPMVAAAAAKLKAMAPRDRLIAFSIAGGAVAIAIAAVVVMMLPTAVVPTGSVVLDAVPWATVAEVRGEDGTLQPLPPAAATPLLLSLPAGSYQVRLVGPPPGTESRDVSIEVTEGSVATPPPTAFRVITPEEYFEPFLTSAPVLPQTAAPGTSSDPAASAPAGAVPAVAPASTPAAGASGGGR